MTYTDFLIDFLRKRNLDFPDGRPLYEYKISNGKYQALKVILTDRWEETKECFACFVLYSVEFLRAESTEGHLRWDYIFNSIGKVRLNTPQIRSRIVEKGLSYWKRKVFQGQNFEFLETLRFESGLPNSSLNDNNNLSSLIKATFQLVESYRLTDEEIINQIEERIEKYPIPQVLRQENFYRLVTKLCFKFLEFKQKFDLSNQPNPTEYLQSQISDWRSEMPLKIEGVRMINFFNGLISDISKLKRLDPLVFNLETILKEFGGKYVLKTLLSIPKGIYSHESLGLEEDIFKNLPGYFCLNLEVEGKAKFLTSFNKLNNGKISSRGLSEISLPDYVFEKEWKLTFTSENLEVRFETELSKRLSFRLDEPLVFVKGKDENYIYKGIAPIKLKESICRILIDDSLYLFKIPINRVGESFRGLSVYQLYSNAWIIDKESQSQFLVKLGQETESLKILDFSQRIFPESGTFDFLKGNEHLYLGFPKVSILNRLLGLKEGFSGSIEVFNEDKRWEISNSNVVGKRKFRFKDRNGYNLGIKTLNVLPSDFKISIGFKSKLIELSSAYKFKVFLSRNGTIAEVNSLGNSIEIIIDPAIDDITKSYINLGVSFNSFGIIDLKIPNPNFKEIFVNGDGKVIERASFSLSKIYGLRIINNNFNGISDKKIYKLKLNDIHNQEASALEIRKEILVDAFSSKSQALYQWSQQINQLFSLTTNTRANVRISSKTPHHYIEISKYDLDLNFFPETGTVVFQEEDEIRDLNLSAFRLDKIFESKEMFDIQLSGSNCNILEKLPTDGIWFLFSNANSNESIIPKVIVKGDKKTTPNNQPIEHLFEACYLEYDQRILRFKEFFDTQYLNFNHPVWKELYDLYKATDHLPISALDVWKGLVKSPKGMLTFLFSQYADSELIQKVSQELGFIWHLVSVYRWHEAFNTWIKYLESSYSNNWLFDSLKTSKLETIKNEFGLDSLVELLFQNILTIPVNLLIQLIDEDINGKEGRLGVRSRHPDGILWSSYAKDFIIDKFQQLPCELKSVFPNYLHGWQKPVIYLPAILAYHSVNGRFIDVQELNPEILLGIKLNMDFDKTYFDDVFSKIQGFCFTQYFNNQKNLQ